MDFTLSVHAIQLVNFEYFRAGTTVNRNKKDFVISLFTWNSKSKDVRKELGQRLYETGLYNEGSMLTTLEMETIWYLGGKYDGDLVSIIMYVE